MPKDESLNILNASPLPTLLVNQQLQITWSNPAARKLFGEDLTGTAFSHLLTPMPLPEILFQSTGALMSADDEAEIRQLVSLSGHVFTASIVQERLSDHQMAVFIRNISEPVDYWSKLHRQKRTEDELSRSKLLRSEDLQAALKEIATRSAATLHVERVNIWLIDEGFMAIRSIMNYERETDQVLDNVILSREDLPQYFQLLATEEIIMTTDSAHDTQTAELAEGYIRRFGIKSMLDVPVRIEGSMVGVICFEELNHMRNWDVSEQKFALSIAQVLAQALESDRRRQAQQKLEQALAEKQLLLREINHRVGNNFSLINDLLHYQQKRTHDDYHRKLFDDLAGRISGLQQLHRRLYQSENISQINFRDFLLDLASGIRNLFFTDGVTLTTQLDSCTLPLNKAMLCAVIVNELLTNASHHAFTNAVKAEVVLRLVQRGRSVIITVEDNGTWKAETGNGMGLQLVEELSRQLTANLQQQTTNGTTFTLTFTAE